MIVEKVVKFRRIHLQLFEAVDQISESMNKFVVLPQRCGQASADFSLIDLQLMRTNARAPIKIRNAVTER